MALFLLILFMLLWRMRGGWNPLDLGTTVARLVFWVIPVLLCTISVFPWELALGSALGAYLGLLIPHGRWFNCSTLRELLFMSCVSYLRVALVLVPLSLACPGVALLSFYGALGGLAYKAGWLFHGHSLQIQWDSRELARGNTEYGELFFGALFGLTMSECIMLYTGLIF